MTGFCCAACPIESWSAWWISHGWGGGVLDKCVDGCWEKNMCYVMKITKQRLAVGLSLPFPPWLQRPLLHTAPCKTDEQTEASMYGIFSTLEGACVRESGSRMRGEVSCYAIVSAVKGEWPKPLYSRSYTSTAFGDLTFLSRP